MELSSVVFVILFQMTSEFHFDRAITAVKFPYYKIEMSLGHCKDSVLFTEQKIWSAIRLNRIFDIYYKSENPYYKVSKVEIQLIVNDTEYYADAENEVGQDEFRAVLIFPTRSCITFYQLDIYTCNEEPIVPKEDDELSKQFLLLPFYITSKPVTIHRHEDFLSD